MLKIHYYDNMTDEMRRVAEMTLNEDELIKEYIYCDQMYEKTKLAGNTKLPLIAENGNNVLVGAKKEIKQLSRYWEQKRDLIGDLIPEYVRKLRCE